MAVLQMERQGNWGSATQVVRLEGEGMVELYVCSRPGRDEGGFLEQARSMYENMHRLLQAQGANPQDVITEKVFFSDVDRQFHDLQDIRWKCYNDVPHTPEYTPATLFLHQPPCRPGRLCELQAYAAIPAAGSEMRVHGLEGLPGLASGKTVAHGGYRQLYLMNLTGEGDDFSAQAEDMFAQAEACLRREGYTYRDVIRTWFYITEIERDYDAFNRVRTRFYGNHRVTRLPASTGIQGGTYPSERGCAMDLLAMTGDRFVDARVIHAPTMNEAPVYGSAFSRGMRVKMGGRDVLHVSGTASIDTEGRVVHVGDVEGQIRRMLANVDRLLAGQGATTKDIVSAITYLKEPGYLEAFHRICGERSVPTDMPNTVSVADICRPEWLCEIEAVAVRPERE